MRQLQPTHRTDLTNTRPGCWRCPPSAPISRWRKIRDLLYEQDVRLASITGLYHRCSVREVREGSGDKMDFMQSNERLVRRTRQVCIALVMLSFVFYGAVLFSVPQIHDAAFNDERSSLAAAVSNVIYGARIGSVYSGVLDEFLLHFDHPLREALDGIVFGQTPPGFL